MSWKFKSVKKSLILILAFMIIAIPTYAIKHKSTITLPRNGWWYTVTRKAENNTQKTWVKNPNADVIAKIYTASGKALSSNVVHSKGLESTARHQTGVQGTSIKARI